MMRAKDQLFFDDIILIININVFMLSHDNLWF